MERIAPVGLGGWSDSPHPAPRAEVMKWSAGAMNRDVTNRDGPQRAGMTAISPAARSAGRFQGRHGLLAQFGHGLDEVPPIRLLVDGVAHGGSREKSPHLLYEIRTHVGLPTEPRESALERHDKPRLLPLVTGQ